MSKFFSVAAGLYLTCGMLQVASCMLHVGVTACGCSYSGLRRFSTLLGLSERPRLVRHNLLATPPSRAAPPLRRPLNFFHLHFGPAYRILWQRKRRSSSSRACCVRCKKFLIFLFKHLTKRASAAPHLPHHPTKKKRSAKKKQRKDSPFFLGAWLPLPFASFLIELITLAWQNIIRIKQHTMQSATAFAPHFPPHPPAHQTAFSPIQILLRFSCWFIFLLMKQLLPGGIMTIIIIMRHAKVAVKASCKIIFRRQLSKGFCHSHRPPLLIFTLRHGLIKFQASQKSKRRPPNEEQCQNSIRCRSNCTTSFKFFFV